jgi:hypothetical protein
MTRSASRLPQPAAPAFGDTVPETPLASKKRGPAQLPDPLILLAGLADLSLGRLGR